MEAHADAAAFGQVAQAVGEQLLAPLPDAVEQPDGPAEGLGGEASRTRAVGRADVDVGPGGGPQPVDLLKGRRPLHLGVGQEREDLDDLVELVDDVVLVDGAVGRVGGEFEGVGHEPEGVHGQAQQRRVGGAVGQGGVDVGAQIEQDRSALGNLAAMAGASPVQALAHLLQGGRGEDIAHEGILGRVQRPPGIGRVTAGGCVRTRHPRPSPISRFDFAPPVMPRGPHPGRHATPPPPDLRNTP